jgi:hypothetical protein
MPIQMSKRPTCLLDTGPWVTPGAGPKLNAQCPDDPQEGTMSVASLVTMVLILAFVVTISRLVGLADRLARVIERHDKQE